MKWNLTNKWLKLNGHLMVIHGMCHPLWRRKLPEVWERGILMGISRLISDQLIIMCSVIYWAYIYIFIYLYGDSLPRLLPDKSISYW